MLRPRPVVSVIAGCCCCRYWLAVGCAAHSAGGIRLRDVTFIIAGQAAHHGPYDGPNGGAYRATQRASGCASDGATGCTAKMLEQWFAERRMQQSRGEP